MLAFIVTIVFALLTALNTARAAEIGETPSITILKEGSSQPAMAQNVMVTISCQPDKPSKFDYLNPEIIDYSSENAALATEATKRPDVDMVASMVNTTPEETLAWFSSLDEQYQDPVRLLIISVSCPAWGGDTDEEVLLMNGGTLPFADLLAAVAPIATSSLWLLDTSRDVSAALEDNVLSFGPTADDVVRYGIVPDAFAISSSAPRTFGERGLIGAAAYILEQTKGEALSLEAFYTRGIKVTAPQLELYASSGTEASRAWTPGRNVLPGDSLIEEASTIELPVREPKKPFMFTPGHGLVIGGGVGILAGGAFAFQAAGDYHDLKQFNEVGGASQDELDQVAKRYRRNTGLAVGIGAVGILVEASGIGWIVLEGDRGEGSEARVTLVPTGNGVMILCKL